MINISVTLKDGQMDIMPTNRDASHLKIIAIQLFNSRATGSASATQEGSLLNIHISLRPPVLPIVSNFGKRNRLVMDQSGLPG